MPQEIIAVHGVRHSFKFYGGGWTNRVFIKDIICEIITDKTLNRIHLRILHFDSSVDKVLVDLALSAEGLMT